jgi:hypothetical protein
VVGWGWGRQDRGSVLALRLCLGRKEEKKPGIGMVAWQQHKAAYASAGCMDRCSCAP